MRGAREGRPRRFAVVLAFLLPLAAPRSARAAEDPVRIVVRTIVPLDDALYERTAGQVSDLPAKVERVPDPALEPSMTARLARATALATRLHAAMVVWFEHRPHAGPVVFIALPSRERVLVRPVAATSSDVMARSTSAMLEAASLVVRNALLAFESGVALGVPNEELTRGDVEERRPGDEVEPASLPSKPEAAPAPKPARSVRAPSAPEPKPSWEPFAGIGWQVSIDGRSPLGARAGVLEGGVRRGRWTALVRGSLGLPSRSHDELVSLEIHRHSASVLAGRTLARAESLDLEALAGAGAVFFRREAYAREGSFAPAPAATHVTAAGTFELRLSWSPSRNFPVRLGVGIGADVLVRPPSFSYETPFGLVERPSRFVEPRLGFVAALR